MRSIVVIIALLFCSCSNEKPPFAEKLNQDWKVRSSAEVNYQGDQVSLIGFNDAEWLDTDIPATVLKVLVDNGVYKDIYKSDNLQKIPTEQFKSSWWYRKEFHTHITKDENLKLTFDGINYRANIWLNGRKLASADTIEGAYNQLELDVTETIKNGENAIAIEIIPPERTDLTIGFVDWNPWPPDNNMGIWREVHLKRSYQVSVKNTFIQTDVNTGTLDEAFLHISTDLINNSFKKQDITVKIQIEDISISKEFKLNSNESRTVYFHPEDFDELNIKSPRLWWPNNLGDPELYNCRVQVFANSRLSDEEDVRFGIREVGQYINNDGHKGFTVNGKKILIKGAGWVDDLLLSDTEEKVEAQMKYVKHMNLNTVRLEGFWGNSKAIYEKADEYGILLMIGWSCHWEWEGYCGRPETQYMCIDTEKDMELQAKGYRDQVLWLRNHPSIFLWVYGSDKLPHPDLERKLNSYLKKADTTRPILACCKYWDFGTTHYNISEVSGPTGVKMLGPYAYVTPNYWYLDTTNGGAFGFNTETGPGPQVPPVESIKKMLPEESYWPIDEMWEFHLGRNEFQTLDRYLEAFNARYGKSKNLEDFAFRSQLSNYEAIRGMFEAFEINKFKATGVIQWMLNSAWPEMFWQLYDWYLMPNGAFYGTKTACQPLNLIYNYADKDIYISNDYNEPKENLTAEIKVFDIQSNLLLDKSLEVNIDALHSKKILDIPELENLSTTYFIDLRLIQSEEEKSRNFYWLSTKEDVPDFKNTQWHLTPYIDYADLTGIKNMPEAEVVITENFQKNNDKYFGTIHIKNKSDKIAFFIELLIVDDNTGESILPIYMDDNYVSLLPGEERTISAEFTVNNQTAKPVLKYQGINIHQ